MTSDDDDKLEILEKAGEVVHPLPGWWVRLLSFFQQLVLKVG